MPVQLLFWYLSYTMFQFMTWKPLIINSEIFAEDFAQTVLIPGLGPNAGKDSLQL